MTLIRLTDDDLIALRQGAILERIGGPSIRIALVDNKGRTADEATPSFLKDSH